MIWRSGNGGEPAGRYFVDLVSVREEHSGITVLHIFDEVDQATAELLEAEIFGSGNEWPPILDFTECRFIDSSVIAVLVRAYKRFGSRLGIVVPKGTPVARVLEITRLDRRLLPWSSLEEALHFVAADGDGVARYLGGALSG